MDLTNLLLMACLVFVLAVVFTVRRSKFGHLATSSVRILSGCFLGACIGGLCFHFIFFFVPPTFLAVGEGPISVLVALAFFGFLGMPIGFAIALGLQVAILLVRRFNATV